MRRRRKEYMSRVPYRKKAARSRSLTKGFGGYKAYRRMLICFSGVLLAIGAVILIVYGCLRLHDNAVEKEKQKLAQAYAEQHGSGANHANTGTDKKDNTNAESNSSGNNVSGGNNGSDSKGNSPEGSGASPVSTPQPTARPSVSPVPSSSSPVQSSLPSPSPEPTTNGHEFDDEMVIVIDAGHGGYDGGSVVGSVVEKDINLAVAQEIARLLEEHGGITVVQTRTSDAHLTLQERSDIGNAAKCDYFVSVHCNTYEADSSVRGFECHYNEKSSEGASFAQSVSNDMKQYKDMKIRSDKPNNLAVTVHTYCPAILIEMGFLTNPTDCANLSNSDYQKQLAERITKAVLKAAGL